MSDRFVKICGVKDAATAIAAARAGADYLGFVFFRKSPRFISADMAEEIIMELKQSSFEDGFELPKLVGLFVDAGEKELSEVAPFLTHFQFHGHENPERCRDMGLEFAVDVIKAVPVSEAADIAVADDYQDGADIILFDAKPPPGAGRPGGNGVGFDWPLLKNYAGEAPFLLAGGLTPDNVAKAIESVKDHSAFIGVDVSSGVENAQGEKDPALVGGFIDAARKAFV